MHVKKFHDGVGKNQVIIKETPTKGSIEKFWKGIWVEEKSCNITASWIGNTEKQMNGFGWTCKRKTCLFAKNNDAKDSKNYRSITCLLTVHKLLTSVLTVRAYLRLEQNDFFPLEQEGCRRGSYGCKDQPMINKMILQNCKKRK